MDGSTRTHRRWWRWWMEPGFADEEWRELKVLAEDLRAESEHLAGLLKPARALRTDVEADE